MIFILSVEIIAVSRIRSILHIDIVTLMRWLVVFTNRMKEYGWGYISMGKVLDNIKDKINMILDQPNLIHDKYFMMGMVDPLAA